MAASAKILHETLAKILNLIELAATRPMPLVKDLEAELLRLEAMDESEQDLSQLLYGSVLRAQTASRVLVIHQLYLILREEARNNSGLKSIAQEQFRLRSNLDDSKSLLRIACSGASNRRQVKAKNREIARARRTQIIMREQDQESLAFERFKRDIRAKIKGLSATVEKHWAQAQALVCEDSDFDSDDGDTLVMSAENSSTAILPLDVYRCENVSDPLAPHLKRIKISDSDGDQADSSSL
jgi:hypothetical protein